MSLFLPVNERRFLRHDVRFECQVVRERDFRLIGTRGVDVSPTGIMVLTPENILTGEDLIVSFRAPGTNQWIDAEATVARMVHGRRPRDPGRAMGLEFRKLDRLGREYLTAGLRRIPPRIPGRRLRYDYAATVRGIADGMI